MSDPAVPVSASASAATTTMTTATTSPRDAATFGRGPAGAPGTNGGPDRRGGRAGAGRTGTVVLLIAALVAAVVTRHLATRFQERSSPTGRRTLASNASLAGMDSYALALLLGGLRGPLVMVLWANSETQKADRNLEGVDTQIEWIRRLQPEFDTVHVFQVWNKAYNLSVQMVGLQNKYTTILDALDYGKNVDAERPDNMNILREIARVYGDKLGNSNPEKYYYRDRIRRETRHRELPAGAQRGQRGFQRLSHDPILGPDGRLLPNLLRARFPGQPYDGSELQFLKRYEPFPFGVSPVALGYNYHKRGQTLMTELDQKPLQVSESVQDSQPGLALKAWAEEEWERGRRLEFKAFGEGKLPAERIDQELPTAALPLDAKAKDPALVAEIIHCYDRAARVSDDSIAEYERHLANPQFVTKRAMYANHIDTLSGIRGMAAGDRDYLMAMQASGAERATLLASAASHYRATIRDYGLTALRYFTSDTLLARVMPPGVTRATIGTGSPPAVTAVNDEDVMRLMAGVRAQIAAQGGPRSDENDEDRREYETYIRRAVERLNLIAQAAQA